VPEEVTPRIMDLLAAEITARTGRDRGEHYQEIYAESLRDEAHLHALRDEARQIVNQALRVRGRPSARRHESVRR